VTGQPGHHRGGGTGQVTAQVVAGPGAYDHLDTGRRVGYPERIAVTVYDQRRQPGHQFGGPGPVGSARGMERKGQREDAGGADRTGGPAGHPGTAGAAADDQRGTAGVERGEDRDPGRVELDGRSRGPATAYPVRLGDPDHLDRGGQRGLPYRPQVRRVDAAPGTVAEDEQTARRTRRTVTLDQGRAVRCGYLGQEATRSTRSIMVRCFGISSSTVRSLCGTSVAVSVRHATSMARRSRGVVAPHTP